MQTCQVEKPRSANRRLNKSVHMGGSLMMRTGVIQQPRKQMMARHFDINFWELNYTESEGKRGARMGGGVILWVGCWEGTEWKWREKHFTFLLPFSVVIWWPFSENRKSKKKAFIICISHEIMESAWGGGEWVTLWVVGNSGLNTFHAERQVTWESK